MTKRHTEILVDYIPVRSSIERLLRDLRERSEALDLIERVIDEYAEEVEIEGYRPDSKVRRVLEYMKSGQFAKLGEASKARYLLQNCTAGCVGNSPSFWRQGGSGYTQWVDEAERFTYEAARQVVRSTRGSHTWMIWPEKMILANVRRTVDVQDLRRARDEAKAKHKRKPKGG